MIFDVVGGVTKQWLALLSAIEVEGRLSDVRQKLLVKFIFNLEKFKFKN